MQPACRGVSRAIVLTPARHRRCVKFMLFNVLLDDRLDQTRDRLTVRAARPDRSR
jgi:hypothetical protein